MKKVILSAVFASLMFSTPIATVNGEDITSEDMALMLKSMPNVRFETLNADQQKQIINQAVDRKLLMQEANKLGTQSSKEFKEALEKVKDDLALEIWMQKELAKIDVSAKEVGDYYTKNKAQYKHDATMRAKHILVKTKAEAEAIIKEIGKSSDPKTAFVQQANAKTIDPSGKGNGGELGYFDAKRMVKPFSEAAFKLTEGEYTKTPVKTEFGFHIIWCEDKKAAGFYELAQATPQIKQIIAIEKFRNQMAKRSADLRKTAKIKIY